MALERLQKILGQAGIASRRQAEELISEGVVTINGQVAKLGDKAEARKDAIKVNGKLLREPECLVYMAFYKPKGVISMLADPQGRPTLKGYLSNVKSRVFPIGRLDFNSEGLILLTNDGDFAQRVQKSEKLVRVYYVKVKGKPDAEMLSRIAKGTRKNLPQERRFKPLSIKIKETLQSKTVIEVVLVGGGAYNLKSLFDTRGFLVEKVVRTAIGHLTVRNIPLGTFRYLKASQAYALLDQPELGLKRLAHESPAPPKTRPRVVIQPKISPKLNPKFSSKIRPNIRPKITGQSVQKHSISPIRSRITAVRKRTVV